MIGRSCTNASSQRAQASGKAGPAAGVDRIALLSYCHRSRNTSSRSLTPVPVHRSSLGGAPELALPMGAAVRRRTSCSGASRPVRRPGKSHTRLASLVEDVERRG